jgi:DNA topoisomerase-2
MAKKIEDRYKVLDQISHVLLRPSTYLGSNKPNISNKWILIDGKMTKKELTIIPSFIKIFDEVITNCVDEHKRNPKLNRIDVTIDTEKNTISVKDNGGIPVEMHKDQKQYVPEVIFGNLMSGSNYDDTEDRLVAGLNGLGSKLANIFSKEFIVSTCDGKKSFYQTFRNNMRDRDKPEVKPSTKNHTQITFTPDLEKFGLDKIDDDHFKIIEKRVYDIAGCNPNLKVYLNGDLIQIKSFEDYIKFYTDTYHFETNKDKSWSVGISHADNGFNQVSFANSTETYDGGNHVDYIMNQIISELRDFFQKKHKVDIKPSELKSHISIFINSTIINPSFSSQTKEKLITEVKDFGFTYPISDKLIKWVLKSEIVQSILDWIDQKKIADENKLARNLNKSLEKIKVEKLIDAKGKERWKCSLTIFEGDCLHEDTHIRILRDGDLIDCKIKNISIDDLVITHKNSFSNIYAITKKIKKKAIIKTLDDDIICSHSHKWFVYDNDINEFYFIETSKIKKGKHKLVKNYLAFTESLIKIKNIDGLQIDLESDQIINCSPDHKFAMYDIQDNKFKMISISDIDKSIHFIVNTFKI